MSSVTAVTVNGVRLNDDQTAGYLLACALIGSQTPRRPSPADVRWTLSEMDRYGVNRGWVLERSLAWAAAGRSIAPADWHERVSS